MSGPLDPEVIKRNCLIYTPETARFMMDLCVERGIKLDGDTVAILIEIGKTDKPQWEPRDAGTIMREILESRGIQLPEPRKSKEEPVAPPVEVPDPLVDEREDEVIDIDEEEHPL